MERSNPPENLKSFDALVEIIARLRAPDGCPWDREQTHTSLRTNLLEECYECLEALDEGNPEKLRGELGDLLLQIVLHSQIAAEAGDFTIDQVIEEINAKLVRRHPHIFGSQTADTADEVAANWEQIKKRERGDDTSALDSVPRQLPALTYSREIQDRVARLGFDWEKLDGVIEKLVEEVAEFRQAETLEERAAEFGDIIFTLVNIARRLGVDSEAALREANRRFFARFSYMEKLCRERGLSFGEMSFEAQNRLWAEAKENTG
jgi:tetrapyrrole methylase family protein/MazG family protein